ncbi:MAG: lysophospholipid acyltransferase family protein [Planctomycetota bacterium]
MSRDLLARTPRLRLLVYRALFIAAERCPLRPLQLLAFLGGWLGWFCDGHGRRTVDANLAALIPPGHPRARERAARRCYAYFGLSIVDLLAAPRLRTMFERAQIVDPWGVFADPPLQGPAIVTTVHANFETALACTRMRGLLDEVRAISLTHDDPAIDALFHRARARYGVRSILLASGPLHSLRALREGALLGIVGDRDYTANGAPCRFLGRPYRLPIGPAALAVQTGCTIHPAVLARRSHTEFVLIAGRPLRADPDLPADENVRALIQSLADIYGRFLRAIPAQWVAFHPVFPHS